MFLYDKTNRYLKNDCQFFDTLKVKDPKIRGNCNLLIKVKLHELEWSSPIRNWLKYGNPKLALAEYAKSTLQIFVSFD